MWTDEQIKGKLLHKLTRAGKFMHSHTDIDNLQKGFPGDLRGRVKELIKVLMKEKILFEKRTSYGFHTSINSSKETRERIDYYISKFFEME